MGTGAEGAALVDRCTRTPRLQRTGFRGQSTSLKTSAQRAPTGAYGARITIR
jgi:hypothetical protein